MSYKISGHIQTVTPTEQIPIGEDTLMKKSVILHLDGEYPKSIAFDAFGKATEGLESFLGRNCEVTFDVKSNQSKKDPTRWFTSARLISIKEEGYTQTLSDIENVGNDITDQHADPKATEEEDDVPF